MKIENWMYNGEEIEVPILSEELIEKNLDVNLEDTMDLSNKLKDVKDTNE